MKQSGHPWNSPLVVFVVVFCLVLATGTFVTRELNANSRTPLPSPKLAFVSNWTELAKTGHVQGSASASVRVVLFADYQCPACAALHQLLKVAADSLGERMQLVTRHFPLSGHKYAGVAANAAECASEQGRFTQFEDVAYQQQDSIGVVPWETFGARAGVRDLREFTRCVRENRFRAAVERDRALAQSLGFAGTPVYVVNGQPYFGVTSLAELLQQLRDAARESASASATSPSDVSAPGASYPVSPQGEAVEASAAFSSGVPGRVVLTSAPAAGAVRTSASKTGTPQRVWFAPPTITRTIAGPPGDELLLPSNLATTASGHLAVFDFGAMEVRTFAADGRPQWRAGRKGAGPGEFRNAMDLETLPNGDIAVLDMGNRRITTVSNAGLFLRTIPLRFSSSRFLPLADSALFGLSSEDSSTFWSAVNGRGDIVHRGTAPAAISPKQAIVRELFTARLGAGSVVAFRWSDKIALLDGKGVVTKIVDGVEPVAFPSIKSYPMKVGKFTGQVSRIDPKAVPGALSVASDGKQLFVLFAGATPNRGRIVDVYDAASGTYIGSHLLSAPAIELAVLPDGSFATLRTEPIPSVDVWSVVATGATRRADTASISASVRKQ